MSKPKPKPYVPARKPDPKRAAKIRSRNAISKKHVDKLKERMERNQAWLDAQRPLGDR